MKYAVYFFTSLCLILCLGTCTLEGAPVIGPAGGYVFYDKGRYSSGWRYLELSPVEAGEFEGDSFYLYKATELCTSFYYGGYNDWRLPTDSELKSMLDMLPKNSLTSYVSSDNTYYLWLGSDGEWHYYNYPRRSIVIHVVREF
jgi:hypothetical protein